ncbi:MAG: prepilin-type N-terminal cleavage/methylation domain-containing protein [Sumerlaeia bacterium]
MKNKAFTLIELLIVVAIIAILAAIAVPNFLEAQVRAKVSRAKSDMRTLATAIESYAVDNNNYPIFVAPNSSTFGGPGGVVNGPSIYNPGQEGISSRFIWLTTPIAYITSVFRDPFIPANVGLAVDACTGDPLAAYDTYDYTDAESVTPEGIISDIRGTADTRGASITSGAAWHLVSAGPDTINAFGGGPGGSLAYCSGDAIDLGPDYDPTNGTVSSGDLVRIGGGPGVLFTAVPAYDRVKNEFNP